MSTDAVPPRPRRDPRPRRARERHRPGRGRRPRRPARRRAARRRAAPAAGDGNGHGEVVTVDFGDLGPAGRMMSAEQHHRRTGGTGRSRRRRSRARRSSPPASQIPRRLPARYDGQPLRHLSHSSYNRFLLCPEDWRRHYLLGETHRAERRDVPRPPRRRRAHALLPPPPRARRAPLARPGQGRLPRRLERAAAEAEREQLGIDWEPDLREDRAFKIGLDALELTFSELIPQLGEPVAVQRRLEYTLAPGLEWSVQCYLDLETLREPTPAQLRAGRRRLQGQDHAADPVQGRPRLPGRPVPRRALARGRPRRASSASPRSPSPARGASR